MLTQTWFKDWFNSPYYYKLYFNRDEAEAAAFIDKLIDHLHPTPDARILYQLKLHKAAEAQDRKHVVQHAIGTHIEDLVLFCREELLAALSKLDIQAEFQRDEFAVRR